ncbi:TlpA disulfide reductase family protein [Desulfuromonas sp. CSMB_57]|jgi:peroxiredoxin|uniref:peroxiredoxin family protein n=1 Tax=Desulfuromonas sp. CSMB_57 TaxID=2807629 RepID=UPI001CD7DC08|nr:TlpA disulfide reductase family protein [Desulfuromonas sp. CSMB_57]
MRLTARIALIGCLLLAVHVVPAAAYLAPGEPAPDVALTDLTGKRMRLSSFRGRNLVLVFGATWCPACKAQVDDLLQTQSLLKKKQITVLTIFLDDKPRHIKKYVAGKRFPVPFHAFPDNGQAQKAYRIFVVPRVIIIDPDFKVVYDGMQLSSKDLNEKFAVLPEKAKGIE